MVWSKKRKGKLPCASPLPVWLVVNWRAFQSRLAGGIIISAKKRVVHVMLEGLSDLPQKKQGGLSGRSQRVFSRTVCLYFCFKLQPWAQPLKEGKGNWNMPMCTSAHTQWKKEWAEHQQLFCLSFDTSVHMVSAVWKMGNRRALTENNLILL